MTDASETHHHPCARQQKGAFPVESLNHNKYGASFVVVVFLLNVFQLHTSSMHREKKQREKIL